MVTRPPEVDAAFAELGLPVDTPQDALRRAYLRVVKVRKPETDPEGFRKAREAFELLSGWFTHLATNQHAPARPAESLDEWATVQVPLNAGDVTGARARIRELLAAGTAPPSTRSLLLLLLEMHRTNPGPDARETLRAFLAWVERARVELAFASQPQRWVLIQEFAKLPAETPQEIERLLLEGIVTGEFDDALRRMARWTEENPVAAEAMILPLTAASPLLHQLLTPVLNLELIHQREKAALDADYAQRQADKRASAGSSRVPGWIFVAAAFALLRVLAGTVSAPGTQVDRPAPAAPSYYATPPPPSALAPDLPASPIATLCTLSVKDCMAAKAVRARLQAHDCLGAELEYATLVNSTTLIGRTPAADAVRLVLVSLRSELSLCKTP